MESQEIFDSSAVMHPKLGFSNGHSVELTNNVEEIENSSFAFLDEMDIYWDDINDRLTISRMVSDSVVRGMVCAVEQEMAEKIAQKDFELARLREKLQVYHVGSQKNGPPSNSVIPHKPEGTEFDSCYSGSLADHDRVQESLSNLKIAGREQFKKLKKEIDRVKGSSSIRRKGSGSEFLGLSGILEEKLPDRWIDVDRAIDGLRTTLDSVDKQVEYMVHLSKFSLVEWQQDRDFQGEVERLVFKNCLQGFQEDLEQRLWDHNAQIYGNESVNWLHKVNEISSVRQELETMSKSLSAPESWQLVSHGSIESRKTLATHVSSNSLWDRNGKADGLIITMPENFDLSQLKHMNRDELAAHFKTEMTKMKRHHESEVQQMTEELFTLKGKYLKERGSSLSVKKDEELDNLRKKIAEAMLKLDGIIVENEKLPVFSNNANSLDSLKERLECLLLENRQLRDSLADKKKELRSLSSQVSDNAQKMLENSLAHANLLRMNADLRCAAEDAQIEASLSEGLNNFLLKELLNEVKCNQESDMENDITQGIYEIICRGIVCDTESTSKIEIEDSDMESIIMQGLCGIIYKEAFRESEERLRILNEKYISERWIRLSLQINASEKEKELKYNMVEKEKLDKQILLLTESLDAKDALLQNGAAVLAKEKENFDLASKELDKLRVQTSDQQLSISKYNEEMQAIKDDLVQALEEIEVNKMEICELRKKLELATNGLSEKVEENRKLLNDSQEKQNALLLFEAREKEYRKQMDSVILLVHGLSTMVTNFECRAAEDIRNVSLRLESLSSEFSLLIQKARRLKSNELVYKEKLYRKCSDLQKAEAEVDLLGDEVETLLSLLEKIYIALDHYSPILQHYPGITEILKLVRRELSGESVKPV